MTETTKTIIRTAWDILRKTPAGDMEGLNRAYHAAFQLVAVDLAQDPEDISVELQESVSLQLQKAGVWAVELKELDPSDS